MRPARKRNRDASPGERENIVIGEEAARSSVQAARTARRVAGHER